MELINGLKKYENLFMHMELMYIIDPTVPQLFTHHPPNCPTMSYKR
jgi:hypothetical protein